MEDLGVTIAGAPFPHMVHHFVLTYSPVEAVSICFSESFEALAEGIEKTLWQIGGGPFAPPHGSCECCRQTRWQGSGQRLDHSL
jgi:hypothetical protein